MPKKKSEQPTPRQDWCLDELENMGLEEERVSFLQGHDDAIIGIPVLNEVPRAVYSEREIVAGLVRQGMSLEEAWDFYYHNIHGCGIGKNPPLILTEHPDYTPAKLVEAAVKLVLRVEESSAADPDWYNAWRDIVEDVLHDVYGDHHANAHVGTLLEVAMKEYLLKV